MNSAIFYQFFLLIISLKIIDAQINNQDDIDDLYSRKLSSKKFWDDIEKPTNDEFQQCYFHIIGTEWTCWLEPTHEYNLDINKLQWPTNISSCCATWKWEQCLQRFMLNESKCQHNDVRKYFQIIHERIVQGCRRWPIDSKECQNGAGGVNLNSNSLSLLMLLFSLIFIVYFPLNHHLI